MSGPESHGDASGPAPGARLRVWHDSLLERLSWAANVWTHPRAAGWSAATKAAIVHAIATAPAVILIDGAASVLVRQVTDGGPSELGPLRAICMVGDRRPPD